MNAPLSNRIQQTIYCFYTVYRQGITSYRENNNQFCHNYKHEEMALVSFQYLESPFSRRIGSYPAFIENDAIPSPSKPYFKGSNSIPVGHPSYYIRKCIQEEIKGNEECQGVYPGNLEVSQLHKYEELCNRFVNAGVEKQLHDVESILDCSSKQYIKSTNPFSNSLSVISFESTRFIIPPHSGFFNGDISDFLQQNHPFQYDVVSMSFLI